MSNVENIDIDSKIDLVGLGRAELATAPGGPRCRSQVIPVDEVAPATMS